jgi:DNA topoisomerase I
VGNIGRMASDSASENVDHGRIAVDAGLRYLTDDRPGIERRRCGRGFTYLDHRGHVVDGAERARLQAMAIPPAWTAVWIAEECDAHLLATGYDDRGRKQYLYHPAWREASDLAKFERLGAVGDALPSLRRDVDHELRTRGADWRTAAAVRLIDDSLIRPGSRRRLEENGSVGAITLGIGDVEVNGTRIALHFEGKSAVEQQTEIRDALLARRLSTLLDESTDGMVFVDADDRPISAGQVNEYICVHSGSKVSAKDLRTWGATCAAADRLVRADGDDLDSSVRSAIEHAAELLGNTVAVCRSAYIAPRILSSFETGELREEWHRSRRARWLSRVEQTVRRVVRD